MYVISYQVPVIEFLLASITFASSLEPRVEHLSYSVSVPVCGLQQQQSGCYSTRYSSTTIVIEFVNARAVQCGRPRNSTSNTGAVDDIDYG